MHITREVILLERFFSQTPKASCGALASFVGLVRNHDHGQKVSKLFYECYDSMAEKQISSLIREAREHWPVEDIYLSHRVGEIHIGEAAVAIAVSSSHREEAFKACRFLIEGVKNQVPIWKRQVLEDGTGEWVLCHQSEEVVV